VDSVPGKASVKLATRCAAGCRSVAGGADGDLAICRERWIPRASHSLAFSAGYGPGIPQQSLPDDRYWWSCRCGAP
jgi:hypothetical protein